ncbi:hypothetical protein BDN71DRAFT_1507658 [Pleurotus eryngii]|uniref:Uncharacterized protein n=1 Tax=Pleurotus eryngii TaxID=5323 RepID=A0A9P5ZV25_PLEER|nr:hypothetical protein BDN71DRAFT_1507658 [Pleurotus eryngii]
MPSPSSVPGPYETVEELEGHVNGILAATERTQRHVDLKSKVAHTGLTLRASDVNPVNFMEDRRRFRQLRVPPAVLLHPRAGVI